MSVSVESRYSGRSENYKPRNGNVIRCATQRYNPTQGALQVKGFMHEHLQLSCACR